MVSATGMPGLEAVRYSRRSVHGAERGHCALHTTFGDTLRRCVAMKQRAHHTFGRFTRLNDLHHPAEVKRLIVCTVVWCHNRGCFNLLTGHPSWTTRHAQRRPRHWLPLWHKSKSSSARVRSCAWPTAKLLRTSKWSPPVRWGWTSRWALVACRVAASSRSTGRSLPARPPSRCRSLPKCRSWVEPAPSSMPSTHSMCSTPPSWACACLNCSSPSRTPVSRPWKSAMPWSVPARSIWSWSTRWLRSRRAPKSRATWAMRCPACRPA